MSSYSGSGVCTPATAVAFELLHLFVLQRVWCKVPLGSLCPRPCPFLPRLPLFPAQPQVTVGRGSSVLHLGEPG